uniref:Uncharacterized protein n=1 Tax=Setaria italica TaxID=4555 RepID=K4AHB7_SETIT
MVLILNQVTENNGRKKTAPPGFRETWMADHISVSTGGERTTKTVKQVDAPDYLCTSEISTHARWFTQKAAVAHLPQRSGTRMSTAI